MSLSTSAALSAVIDLGVDTDCAHSFPSVIRAAAGDALSSSQVVHDAKNAFRHLQFQRIQFIQSVADQLSQLGAFWRCGS